MLRIRCRGGNLFAGGVLKTLDFAGTSIDRCVESEGPSFYPSFIFPSFDADAFERERSDWLDDTLVDSMTGRLLMSLHSYVIRSAHHTILVDTCVGNHKPRPETRAWHMRNGPFLEDLAAMGVAPESVDYVLCTHLHVDHVGWNTQLRDGRWVPTFPNAKYLFHEKEYAYWESAEMAAGSGATRRAAFEDSVLPVVAAGQTELVSGDHQLDDSVFLEHAPGHTPGHVFVHLRNGGHRAVFTGDCLHHPLQIAYPRWSSRYCTDPERSAETRCDIVERVADTDTLMLGAHFPTPVAGRVVSNGERCKLSWL